MNTLYKSVAALATLPLLLAAWSYERPAPALPRSPDRAFTDMTITLDGASERPNKVTTDATGTAKFAWASGGPISYVITVKALSSTPTAAHIHGPADSEHAVGVLVTFHLDSIIPNGTIATGTINEHTTMSISLDSLKKLMSTGHAYVNVHSTKHPGGEIRGQFK